MPEFKKLTTSDDPFTIQERFNDALPVMFQVKNKTGTVVYSVDKTGAVVSNTTTATSSFFDVKNYGAVGNGTTNDTIAIQNAIDAAVAVGGGTVFFSSGVFICNGVTIPVNVPIWLQGSGMGNQGRTATTLRRNINGFPIVKANGTGPGQNQRCFVTIRDMELDGGGYASDILWIYRPAHMQLSSLRVVNGTGVGAHFTEAWDSFADRLLVEACGGGTAAPACLIDGVTGGGTDTFFLSNCIFQTNGGTDIKLTGTNVPCNNVRFTNTKMENSQPSTVAPHIDFDYAQNCGFIGLNIYLVRTGAFNVIQQGTNCGTVGYRPNSIIGAAIDCGGQTPTNILSIAAGWFQGVAMNFQRSSGSTQDVYIAAAVPLGAVQLSSTRWSQAVTDLRTFNEHLEYTSQNPYKISFASYAGASLAAGATFTATLNWNLSQNGTQYTPMVTVNNPDVSGQGDLVVNVTGMSYNQLAIAVKNTGSVAHTYTVFAVAIPY